MKWWWIPLILLVAVALFFWQNSKNTGENSASWSSKKSDSMAEKKAPSSEADVSNRDNRSPQNSAEKAAAKSSRDTQQIYSISEFEREYPGNWKFSRRGNSAIQSITGGLIEDVGKNSESIREFAQKLSPLLAEGQFELASESRVVANTDKLSSYDIQQFAQGIEVYQGSIQMLSRNTDGAVYIINNRLRDITNFNPQPELSVVQGEQIVKEKYAGAEIKSPARPKVFALRGQNSQLAWIYDVVQRKPKHSHKDVVVSAVDGTILYEEEYTIHD